MIINSSDGTRIRILENTPSINMSNTIYGLSIPSMTSGLKSPAIRYPTCYCHSLQDRNKEFPVRLSVKEMRIVDPDNDPDNETRAPVTWSCV